jgi:glycogen debranching enzyme
VYDGDSPHKPGACISQAWSVAELLRMQYLIDTYKTKVQTKDIQEAKRSLQYEQ